MMASLFHSFDIKLTKPFAIAGGCVVIGLSTYGLYSYFKNKSRMTDEGFVDITVVDESTKKILVLGLDGAGKSTFLSNLARLDENSYKPDPTKEFNVLSVNYKPNKNVNFWEIGGSKTNRAYWSNFIEDTDLLIYMVDSVDEHKLAESVKEFQILTACDKLRNVPILILANKQDVENSASPINISAAFGVIELSRTNKVSVFPLAMPPKINNCNETVAHLKSVVIHSLSEMATTTDSP